uniref:Uncharacterized protein n=1 Tax=Oryzias latipes TaxID=8090 RepID=A0A3P9JQW4_ORYLA
LVDQRGTVRGTVCVSGSERDSLEGQFVLVDQRGTVCWIREGQLWTVVLVDQRGTVCVSGSERDSLEGQFVLVDQRGTVCVSGSERDSCVSGSERDVCVSGSERDSLC